MRVITEMQGPETLQSIVTWSCTMKGNVTAKGERIYVTLDIMGPLDIHLGMLFIHLVNDSS